MYEPEERDSGENYRGNHANQKITDEAPMRASRQGARFGVSRQ